jgi:hypothetical protein
MINGCQQWYYGLCTFSQVSLHFTGNIIEKQGGELPACFQTERGEMRDRREDDELGVDVSFFD